MSHERAGTRPVTFPWGRLLYFIVFVSLAVAGLCFGYVVYVEARAVAAQTTFTNIPIYLRPIKRPSTQSTELEQPNISVSNPETESPQMNAQASVNTLYPNIEDQSPINILFMGIDQRAGEKATCRTDTMILVSINPAEKSVSLLSIPRDLWVPIPHPEHEFDKITTAHYWGEIEAYPGGGPALAMKTVHNTIGIRPHYFVRLNFTGFERIIDTIGGLDITVPETIDDDRYPNGSYGYEHLVIEAGEHHFDGEIALKYARTRYGSDDFTRMARQQQLIMAVRDQVLRLDNLPQLIAQLPQLYRDLGDSLETDIPIDLMISLAELALDIKSDNIRSASIDRRMTSDAKLDDGTQVLLYNPTKARAIIDLLFRIPTPQVPVEGTNQVERLNQESAQVIIYNGTGIKGLAGRVTNFLLKQGLDMEEPQNAGRFDYEHTTMHVYVDKPFTVDWLINVFSIDPEHVIYQPFSAQDQGDISIIIGEDFPADQYP